MKQKSLWMLTMLLACCISLVFSSCTDDDGVEPTPPAPEGPTLLPSVEPIDPVQCSAKVDLGDISSLPEELQTALKNRFPNMTANGDADICFCKASDVEKFSAELLKGTTTIVAMPGNGGAMDNIINLAGGVVPKKTALPIMFYGTQKWGQHYVMLDGGIPYDLNTTEEKVEFYERRIIPLVYWLNEVEEYKKARQLRLEAAQNDDSPYDYDELITNIEDDGLSLKCNFPYSLDNTLDYFAYDFDLKASSSIDFGLKVYPIYKQSCHDDKSGDYYVVTAEVTPYNQNMWKAYRDGITMVGYMYMMGYWFNDMHTAIKLVDKDGNDIPGIDYNKTPIPENAADSRQYSSGTSSTVGGSACAGFASGAPMGSLSLSFSHTVNSTVSYTKDDIDYTLDSSTKEVRFYYQSKGVSPYADDDDDDGHYPKSCRTQWTARQAWVWFVPRGQAGVDDNSDSQLQIYLNGDLSYDYYWWVYRYIGPNDSGDTYSYKALTITNQAWQLKAPNRNTWGLTSIKSEYTDAVMANLKYYKKGEEEKDPVATDNMSYRSGEYALMGLPDGCTYTIIYETKDPNTGEHMDSWKFENVEVHQGKTKDEATTALSSVNATKIDKK